MIKLIKKLYAFLNRRDSKLISKDKFKELEKTLGVKIHNKDIFIQALTHRSFVPVAKQKYGIKLESNERLEFHPYISKLNPCIQGSFPFL